MSIKKENPKVDFVKNEHEILDYWSKNKIFEKLVKKNSSGPKWSFLDGPITANNPMGVHHAWGRTLKDIGWIGTILISLCPKKTTMQFGLF